MFCQKPIPVIRLINLSGCELAGRADNAFFCKSSKIAATELDALALFPTKRSPPALTCPFPTQRLRPFVASSNRAVKVV
jgi:hypothetical protein